MEKSCSRCKQVKLVECFIARKDQPGKYTSQCKICRYDVKQAATIAKYGVRPIGRQKIRTDAERIAIRRAANKLARRKQRLLEREAKIAAGTHRSCRPKMTPEQVKEKARVAANVRNRARGIPERERLTPEEAARRRREQQRVAKRNRAIKKRGAVGRHTRKELLELHERQKYRCAICHCSTAKERHIDHIVAIANGGSNSIENLQILCPPCNMAKGARDPVEYMQSIGKLL